MKRVKAVLLAGLMVTMIFGCGKQEEPVPTINFEKIEDVEEPVQEVVEEEPQEEEEEAEDDEQPPAPPSVPLQALERQP